MEIRGSNRELAYSRGYGMAKALGANRLVHSDASAAFIRFSWEILSDGPEIWKVEMIV